MGQGLDMTVNSLPSRTWNWLKMNESKLKDIETGDTCEVEKINGASENITGSSVEAAEKKADFSDILTGMGRDMDLLGEKSGSVPIVIESSRAEAVSKPVRLHFSCKDGKKEFSESRNFRKRRGRGKCFYGLHFSGEDSCRSGCDPDKAAY